MASANIAENRAECKGTDTKACVSKIVETARKFKKSKELAIRGKIVREIIKACESKEFSMLLNRDFAGKSFIVKTITDDSNENRSFPVAWAEVSCESEAILAMEEEFSGSNADFAQLFRTIDK